MKRALLIGLIALLGGCASWHRLGNETVATGYQVQVSLHDGFPGQVVLNIDNTGTDAVHIKLGTYPVVIAETGSADGQIGEIIAEVCDEDGVCSTEAVTVYVDTEEALLVQGVVTIEPESFALGPGESATCAVTLINYSELEKRFMLRIHALVTADTWRERSVFSVPGERFSRGGFDTW